MSAIRAAPPPAPSPSKAQPASTRQDSAGLDTASDAMHTAELQPDETPMSKKYGYSNHLKKLNEVMEGLRTTESFHAVPIASPPEEKAFKDAVEKLRALAAHTYKEAVKLDVNTSKRVNVPDDTRTTIKQIMAQSGTLSTILQCMGASPSGARR